MDPETKNVVKYIVNVLNNMTVVQKLKMKWPEAYIKFSETDQKEVIRTSHIELSRAVPLCQRYLEGIMKMSEDWTLTERFRSLAVVSSNKHKGSAKSKIVIAVRISEPRYKI